MSSNFVVDNLIEQLRDPGRAEPCAGFPRLPASADSAGLYSWWADDEGLDVLSGQFGSLLPPLIYAGQAGATSSCSNIQRAATLRSRIGGNHLNGNVGSSTLRKTLSALLRGPLVLGLAQPGRLDQPSNARVSAWMRAHLHVAIAPYPNRATLAEIETEVLRRLNPPLNLMGMPNTAIRLKLKALRGDLGRGERELDHGTQQARDHPMPEAIQPVSGSEQTPPDSFEGSLPSQPVTASDRECGRVRVPSASKRILPSRACVISVTLKGRRMHAKWDPRMGPDRARSGTIGIPRLTLTELVPVGTTLTLTSHGEGLIDLQ